MWCAGHVRDIVRTVVTSLSEHMDFTFRIAEPILQLSSNADKRNIFEVEAFKDRLHRLHRAWLRSQPTHHTIRQVW